MRALIITSLSGDYSGIAKEVKNNTNTKTKSKNPMKL